MEDTGLTWYQIAAITSSLVCGAYVWIFLRIVNDQRKLESNLSKHVEETQRRFDELPDRYVRRDDFADFKGEVMDALKRIEGKLDKKVDR